MSDQASLPGTAPTTLPATAAETSPDNPWPLQLLSQKLKAHIDRTPSAWVEGQVIELNRRGTNAYLTLRDVDAEVSLPASVWTKVLERQNLPLERGSRVVALLKPEFWMKTGRLNMLVRDIRPVGLGDLLARIERLRQALAAEGLFADSRKKPLPLLPHRIGLITGRDSDAKKDILRNAALRWPAVEFEIREVAVQGNTAVSQVVRALGELDALPGGGRHCHCPGRRSTGRPPAVQQRGPCPGGGCGSHPGGQCHRARGRPSAAGLRGRSSCLHPYRRCQTDRSGSLRGAGRRATGTRTAAALHGTAGGPRVGPVGGTPFPACDGSSRRHGFRPRPRK